MTIAAYLSALLLVILPQHLKGDASSDVLTIQNEFWEWRLREAPEFATFAGDNRYNDRLDSYNMTTYTANKVFIDGLVRRLNNLKSSPSFAAMSSSENINYLVLKDMLQSYVDGYQWHLYSVGNPVSFLEGPQLNVDYRFDISPFETKQDFVNFLSRMNQLPGQIDDIIILMRGAISSRYTNHNSSMSRVLDQVDEIITAGLQGQWFSLYKERVDNSSLTDADKSTLLSEARHTVINDIIPAYQRMREFIADEYLQHTRSGYGVSSFPNGAAFYQAALKWHLSVDMTPDQVHDKGMQEVGRISLLMCKIIDRQNFTGSIKEYFDNLKANPKFHVNSQEGLLAQFRDIIFNRATPKLTQLFKNIPDLPVKVEPMPYDGPGGVYFSGSADGKRPGVFQVNLRHPEIVNTFDMAALSLHETVPGHHLQDIFSLKASLPAFRGIMDTNNYFQVPFHFPFYTAYMEGWGLYAEYLGEELGVYKDDFELMGRYSGEMFRACRLVVDTGIHAKGWTRKQAIDFMMKYTAEPRYNVEIEVDRYITWPGQACAYKIGELKLRELRETAKRRLGTHFDVRDFHSTILNAGALPLNVLDKIVNDWIGKQLASLVNPIG